jgi:hypothetical protein
MGQIVFQATLGGQTALVGQNTASSFSLNLPLASDTLVGKATTDTLTNKTISGSSNTLSNIGNSALTNSSLTIGSTAISLGATSTTLAGLSTINGSTLPTTSGGTVMVSNNMPTFSAYADGTQTISATTFTKVLFPTEEFDTNNNFASSRFTPTVAGYYQVNSEILVSSTVTVSRAFIQIYKNGSLFKNGNDIGVSASQRTTVSCLIYCNGSSDYIETYCYANGTGTLGIGTGPNDSYFQACLVRGA